MKEKEEESTTPPQKEKSEKPIFRFLTANQVLELQEFRARQELPVVPGARVVPKSRDHDDDALAFVFVSHRWGGDGDPDPDGRQLTALQMWLRYVEELLRAVTVGVSDDEPEFSWPVNLHDMVEGMPQAASLVSRITLDVARPEVCRNPLDHIFLWYDCACLPQNFPNDRTEEEKEEFGLALRNLDQLAQKCEVLYLFSDDYFERAWCSFEHFQKMLDDFQGHIMMDCDKVLQEDRVDWEVEMEDGGINMELQTSEERRGPKCADNAERIREMIVRNKEGDILGGITAMEQLLQSTKKDNEDTNSRVRGVMNRSRQVEFNRNQMGWEVLHQDVKDRQQTANVARKKYRKIIGVPDLVKGRIRIQNATATSPPNPPLVDAMTCLIRELFTAVFHMSCRDAALLDNGTPIPPNLNACVEGVGVQCGLHDHRMARPLEEQRQALQECIETGWKKFRLGKLLCPAGHMLQPGVTTTTLRCDGPPCKDKKMGIAQGHVHAGCSSTTCDYDLCYFCATGKEQDVKAVLSSQQCFDEVVKACSDCVAKVPHKEKITETLCERQVTIDLFRLANDIFERFGLRCTNDSDVAFVGLLALRNILSLSRDDDDRTSDKREVLEVSAGSLHFLLGVFEEAVLLYSVMLANNEKVSSLIATIRFMVPRWVLLDMATGKLNTNTSLVIGRDIDLGRKVRRYLTEHPDCISKSFHTKEMPLTHRFCQHVSNCHGGWAPCAHEAEKSVLLSVSSVVNAGGTLDPWASVTFPTALACFVCLCVNKKVYVIGGARDLDPETQDYTTCLANVYCSELPLSTSTTWVECGALEVARRNHAGCVQTDAGGKPVALLIGGGRATSIFGHDLDLSSSIESLILPSNNQKGTNSPKWEKKLEMPRARSSHHMAFVRDCLFVFCGRTEHSKHTPESQKCDIFDYRRNEWIEGPLHPVAFAGGTLVVLHSRFAWVFGGATGTRFLKQSWILDLRPWVQWIAGGCKNGRRPKTGWVKGPNLPSPMACPNVCLASREETGLNSDWILSVAPSNCGNYCFALKLPVSEPLDDKEIIWSEGGVTFTNTKGLRLTHNLSWEQLSATPDAFALGATFVACGMLVMICGESMFQRSICNSVHFRQLPKSGSILPKRVVDSGFSRGDGLMAMIRGMSNGFAGNEKIQLVNNYLIGRLGFPISEEDLIGADGTKKLRIADPHNLHCQRCLVETRSLKEAKAHDDTAFYGIKPAAQTSPKGRWKPIPFRMVPLCSECVCDQYFNKKS